MPLEELIHGRRVANERGEFFLVEDDVHLETLHGDVPLSRFRGLDAGTVALLSGDPALEGFDLADAVFLDTETTGLAGGTGTAAFLVGIGYVRGRPLPRAPVLHARLPRGGGAAARPGRGPRAASATSSRSTASTFDIPLLESRYALNRERYPLGEGAPPRPAPPGAAALEGAAGVLPPAGRWRPALLGLRRARRRARGRRSRASTSTSCAAATAAPWPRVLEHNRLDVVSLAALAALAGQWVEEGRAEDPRDVYAWPACYERARLFDRSEAHYRRVLARRRGAGARAGAPAARRPRQARGRPRGAPPLWEEAAGRATGGRCASSGLHHEHRSRDLETALAVVEQALADLGGVSGRDVPYGLERVAADLRRRRHRLVAKRARQAANWSRGLAPERVTRPGTSGRRSGRSRRSFRAPEAHAAVLQEVERRLPPGEHEHVVVGQLVDHRARPPAARGRSATSTTRDPKIGLMRPAATRGAKRSWFFFLMRTSLSRR